MITGRPFISHLFKFINNHPLNPFNLKYLNLHRKNIHNAVPRHSRRQAKNLRRGIKTGIF